MNREGANSVNKHILEPPWDFSEPWSNFNKMLYVSFKCSV